MFLPSYSKDKELPMFKRFFALFTLLLSVFVVGPALVHGQSTISDGQRPLIVRPDHSDVSPPLRELNFFGKARTRQDFEPKRTEPLGNTNSKGTDPLAATSFTTTAATVSAV